MTQNAHMSSEEIQLWASGNTCEFFQMYFCVSTQSPQYIHVNSKRSLIETVCFFHFWQQNSIFYHINIYWHSLCLFNTFYFTSNDIAAVYKPFKCSCWRNTTLCTRLALFCKMTCMSLFSICQFFSFLSLLLPQWIPPCDDHKKVFISICQFLKCNTSSRFGEPSHLVMRHVAAQFLLKSFKCCNFDTNSVLRWYCILWIFAFVFFISLWYPIKCCCHTGKDIFHLALHSLFSGFSCV